MRFPDKREWSALTILYRAGPRLNLGEALSILRVELCVTKRTARRIVKRLKRLGLLRTSVEGGEVFVEAFSPFEALTRLVDAYISRRKSRCRLPRG